MTGRRSALLLAHLACPSRLVPFELNELSSVLSGEGASNQVSLSLIETFGLDQVELVLVLYTFHRCDDPQGAANCCDSSDNGQALLAAWKICNEAAIDFDFVKGKRSQIPERRIACAEVVDCNFHAELSDRVEYLEIALTFIKHYRTCASFQGERPKAPGHGMSAERLRRGKDALVHPIWAKPPLRTSAGAIKPDILSARPLSGGKA